MKNVIVEKKHCRNYFKNTKILLLRPTGIFEAVPSETGKAFGQG